MTCQDCNGNGIDPGQDWTDPDSVGPCGKCNGTGNGGMTCPDCEGKIHKSTAGWTAPDGKVFPPIALGPCRTCEATGEVTIDRAAILAAIKGRKGLRTSKPKDGPYGAAYVWRMARFHGGIDTTMPVTCFWTLGIGGIINDAGRKILDILDPMADDVARAAFGTDMGAAKAWRNVL